MGAFDERIKLTIPQESGSGGSASWRVSDWMASQGQETQTLSQNHSAFPSSQQSEVNAYIQKFLIGGGAGNTDILRNDPGVTFNQAMWVNWTPEILGQIHRLYQSSQLLKPAE